jgi:hypothetical protein
LAQALGNYFTPGDKLGERIAGLTEFYEHFDWAVLPLIVDDADYSPTDLDEQDPQCFRAGTLVMTEHGARPIESIVVGERVWAYDEFAAKRGLKRVAKTFRRERTNWLKLGIDGTFVEVTAEHPFYVLERGWCKADGLSVGDRLLPFEPFSTSVITSLETIVGATTVFNLEVDDLHNYFITDEGVLVHNGTWSPAYHHYVTRALGSRVPYAARIIQASGKLNAFRHIRLHRELNTILNGKHHPSISGLTMMPSRRNSGLTIRAHFSRRDRLAALSQFYRHYQSGKYFQYFQNELRAIVKNPSLFQ